MQIFHDLEDDYMEKSFFHQLIQRKLGMNDLTLEMIKRGSERIYGTATYVGV